MLFLKTVVAFPPVAAGDEREAVLWIADQLCAELGHPDGVEEVRAARSALDGIGRRAWADLSPEEELLVAAVRTSLAKVVAAIWATRSEVVAERAVRTTLDGAELLIRGELASGNAARLPALMPDFVFLVTLPIVEQDEALQLSKRTAELIEAASGW